MPLFRKYCETANMTMIEEKISQLIVALIDKTGAGKVTWKKTVSANRLLVNFSLNAVSITRIPNNNINATYVFSLLDDDGNEIESKTEYSSTTAEHQKLEQLFNLARRSANNVEESLDSLLKTLESV